MQDFDAKTAVITGAASGIGRATAALFARIGTHVVLADIDPEGLTRVADEIAAEGGSAHPVLIDVADPAAVERLADDTFDRRGAVHILFLNAGIGGGANFFSGDLASWHRVLNVNVYGVIHGIRAFVPRMHALGQHAHVVATSSPAGAHGTMYSGAGYATSKAAVASLMECLYGQLRDLRSEVRASCLLPLVTDTNLGGAGAVNKSVAALQRAGVPANLVTPEAIAHCVLEGIFADDFWISPTIEQDERLFDGQAQDLVQWLDERVLAKAKSLINRTAPDPYLWGPSSS